MRRGVVRDIEQTTRSIVEAMRDAERVRPWWIEGDYSYKIDRLAGPGWLLVGDALRFVDPIFSTGVDVAMFSANFAADAIVEILGGGDPAIAAKEYERRVGDGVEIWYRLMPDVGTATIQVAKASGAPHSLPAWRHCCTPMGAEP